MIQLESLRLIFVFIVAWLLAFSATPIVRVLAVKIGAVDVPKDARRVHKEPIPRLGGLAIFYGFIVSILCFIDVSIEVRGVLIGAVIIVTLGVLDDVKSLPAWAKLLVQIFAAWIVAWHGVMVEGFTPPLSGGKYIVLGAWAVPLTIFWIVGVTNAVNLLDGLDGLAVGISSITAVSLIVISIIMGQETTAILSVALAGAGFGFIPFNFHPAKIFMGDTGSTFLGFVLACISIMGLFKVYAVISFAVPFFILALPLLDTSIAILRRIAKGQSPMTADRGHLHHKLIDRGFTQKQAVTTLYALSGLLSLSAVVMMINEKIWQSTKIGAMRGFVLIAAVLSLTAIGHKFIFQEHIDLFKFENRDSAHRDAGGENEEN